MPFSFWIQLHKYLLSRHSGYPSIRCSCTLRCGYDVGFIRGLHCIGSSAITCHNTIHLTNLSTLFKCGTGAQGATA